MSLDAALIGPLADEPKSEKTVTASEQAENRQSEAAQGNKTLEQALAAGHKDVLVVKTDGSKLVAVQRMDLDLKDKRTKALAIADNRVGELDLEWDTEVLGE